MSWFEQALAMSRLGGGGSSAPSINPFAPGTRGNVLVDRTGRAIAAGARGIGAVGEFGGAITNPFEVGSAALDWLNSPADQPGSSATKSDPKMGNNPATAAQGATAAAASPGVQTGQNEKAAVGGPPVPPKELVEDMPFGLSLNDTGAGPALTTPTKGGGFAKVQVKRNGKMEWVDYQGGGSLKEGDNPFAGSMQRTAGTMYDPGTRSMQNISSAPMGQGGFVSATTPETQDRDLQRDWWRRAGEANTAFSEARAKDPTGNNAFLERERAMQDIRNPNRQRVTAAIGQIHQKQQAAVADQAKAQTVLHKRSAELAAQKMTQEQILNDPVITAANFRLQQAQQILSNIDQDLVIAQAENTGVLPDARAFGTAFREPNDPFR